MIHTTTALNILLLVTYVHTICVYNYTTTRGHGKLRLSKGMLIFLSNGIKSGFSFDHFVDLVRFPKNTVFLVRPFLSQVRLNSGVS